MLLNETKNASEPSSVSPKNTWASVANYMRKLTGNQHLHADCIFHSQHCSISIHHMQRQECLGAFQECLEHFKGKYFLAEKNIFARMCRTTTSTRAVAPTAWRTDEIRRTPPTPQDEMRAGLSYFTDTIFKVRGGASSTL